MNECAQYGMIWYFFRVGKKLCCQSGGAHPFIYSFIDGSTSSWKCWMRMSYVLVSFWTNQWIRWWRLLTDWMLRFYAWHRYMSWSTSNWISKSNKSHTHCSFFPPFKWDVGTSEQEKNLRPSNKQCHSLFHMCMLGLWLCWTFEWFTCFVYAMILDIEIDIAASEWVDAMACKELIYQTEKKE